MANRFGVWTPGAGDQARKAAAAALVADLGEKDYEAQVVSSALPVVLGFYASGSKAWEELAPRLEAVATRYAGKVRFLKVAAETGASLATRLGVTGSPAVLFLQGGKEVGQRLAGEAIPRTAIKAGVEGLLGPAVVAAPAAAPTA